MSSGGAPSASAASESTLCLCLRKCVCVCVPSTFYRGRVRECVWLVYLAVDIVNVYPVWR